MWAGAIEYRGLSCCHGYGDVCAESANLAMNTSSWSDNAEIDESRQLRDEVNFLRKKLAVADQELQAADVLRKDLEGLLVSSYCLEEQGRLRMLQSNFRVEACAKFSMIYVNVRSSS